MWLCTDYLEYMDYESMNYKLAYELKHRRALKLLLDFHLKLLAHHLKLSESFSLYYIPEVENSLALHSLGAKSAEMLEAFFSFLVQCARLVHVLNNTTISLVCLSLENF